MILETIEFTNSQERLDGMSHVKLKLLNGFPIWWPILTFVIKSLNFTIVSNSIQGFKTFLSRVLSINLHN